LHAIVCCTRIVKVCGKSGSVIDITVVVVIIHHIVINIIVVIYIVIVIVVVIIVIVVIVIVVGVIVIIVVVIVVVVIVVIIHVITTMASINRVCAGAGAQSRARLARCALQVRCKAVVYHFPTLCPHEPWRHK